MKRMMAARISAAFALLLLSVFARTNRTAISADTAAAAPGDRKFALETCYLHQALEGAHRIRIVGSLDEQGTGKGKLTLDPNTCMLDLFGDPTGCTLIGFKDIDISLKRVKPAAAAARSVYVINGSPLANQLYLVFSYEPKHASRLVSEGRDGVQRVVTLENLAAAGGGGGAVGSTAANGLEAKADPPLGIGTFHALQVPGMVVVVAQGTNPTSGFKTYLQQSLIDVFPPQFILINEPPKPGDIVNPVITPFLVAAYFPATEPVKSVVVHDAKGPHEVPVIPVKQNSQPDTPTERGSTVVTGISTKLSFDEAMADAVRQLKPPFPDAMFQIKVLEIGGEIGGIAGLRKLSVKVEATVR